MVIFVGFSRFIKIKFSSYGEITEIQIDNRKFIDNHIDDAILSYIDIYDC